MLGFLWGPHAHKLPGIQVAQGQLRVLTRVCCTERFSACVLLKPIFAWVCLFNVQKHLVWKHYSLNAFRPELKEACYRINNLLSMWSNWAVKDEVKKQLPRVSPFYSCLFHAGVFHNVIFHKTYSFFFVPIFSHHFFRVLLEDQVFR